MSPSAEDILQQLDLAASPPLTFDVRQAADKPPRVVRLAQGPRRPGILGFPATAPPSGPHQYVQFAKTFRTVRDVSAISVPGFIGQERVPATIRVAVEVEAEAVRRHLDGASVVLAGYSSGGTLAYGVAHHLENSGVPVAGVVLFDAYPFRVDQRDVADGRLLTTTQAQEDAFFRTMVEDPELRRYFTPTRLSATAWYGSLLRSWKLAEVKAPTLLVRPEEAMPGVPPASEWKATWPFPHSTVDVPGNHWTMMLAHADSTAEAVEQWLSSTPMTTGK